MNGTRTLVRWSQNDYALQCINSSDSRTVVCNPVRGTRIVKMYSLQQRKRNGGLFCAYLP